MGRDRPGPEYSPGPDRRFWTPEAWGDTMTEFESRKTEVPEMILNGLKQTALLFLLFLVTGASPALAEQATPEMLRQDVARFTALGAVYEPQGFAEMKTQKTPYQEFRRVDSRRLMGRTVYSVQSRIRLWKQLFCGNLDVVVLELSLRDAAGRRIPFAWQDCSIICEHGGSCSGGNPLYLDLDGDGRPDTKFLRLDSISSPAPGSGWAVRRNFTRDIIPSWVKAEVGPDFKNLHPLGPDKEAPFGQDHPTSLGPSTTVQDDD